MISQTFVDAWLQYRDTGQLPTDKHAGAFCLMIEQALLKTDAVEVHASELQAAELWDHAIEAGECIRSLMAAEHPAHPQLEAVLQRASDRAAIQRRIDDM
jgi:hypothetical protein